MESDQQKSWIVWHKPDPSKDEVQQEVFYSYMKAVERYSELEQKYCPLNRRSSMRVGMFRDT